MRTALSVFALAFLAGSVIAVHWIVFSLYLVRHSVP